MEAIRLFKSLDPDQRKTFLACFLGWALDALDFFLLTFVLVPISHEFGHSIPEVAFAITLTLMARPLGAFIFGLLGDKFGRRVPLMMDIVFYSVMELLTAFAPNFTVFLILRALFGVGMGGEWGARRSQWNRCRRKHAGCSPEFCSRVTRLVICSQPWFTGSCFRISDGADYLSPERCRHFS